MLNHVTYIHPTSTQWVTFVHGAGGSYNTWFKQIKVFKTNFNVLLLDLRGHGNSEGSLTLKDVKYTFEFIAYDIIHLLDYLKIKQSHFVAISLGTIIVRELAQLQPEKVSSLILAGAIMKLNLRSWLLVKLGNAIKGFMPYITLYAFFAYIIMPRKNHKTSRDIFINEAKKLNQLEFVKWFGLASEVNPVLKIFRKRELPKPTLYIMGDQDAMFLPTIKKLVIQQNCFSTLVIVNNSGHVVNLDSAYFFNDTTVGFIYKNAV